MNRKHFIKISGGSLAAAMVGRFLTGGNLLLKKPDEVSVQSQGIWKRLVNNGAQEWIYRDIAVSIGEAKGANPVRVSSPSLPLEAVCLEWQYPANPESKCLGDHWERSYGDLGWRAPDLERRSPWYVMIHDGHQTQGFGVKTGCHAISYCQVGSGKLRLTLDTRSGGVGVHLGDRVLYAAELVVIRNEEGEGPFETARKFCRRMCSDPILPDHPVYGINDWYFAYGNNSRELILERTRTLSDLAPDIQNRPYSVIDAGWAAKSPLMESDCCWGEDFSRSNAKFGDMSLLAKEIRDAGMLPGLWVRPLCARHNERTTLLMPEIPGRNDPRMPILDPSIPENLERIRSLMKLFGEWGFRMIKHDYSSYDVFGRWGFEMSGNLTADNWHFHDRGLTNAEIVLQLYRTIRIGAGALQVIGCNSLSHLSAGQFQLNRIGDDTSGQDWKRTRKMGVNTLGFRIVQQGAFYETDADCVGITQQVPWEKNRQWMRLLAESGTPLFVSADPGATGPDQKQAIRESFTLASKRQPLGEPLDWLSDPLPSRWKLNGKIVEFNWND
jgi:alpha-galactosidase